MDVDIKRTRLIDNPFHPGTAAGQLLPPAALTGTDHNLGDLIPPREAGDGPGGIVVLYLVPAGTQVRGQLPQLLDGLVIPRPGRRGGKGGKGGKGRVAGGDVDDVEFSLEPGCHPGRPPQQAVGPWHGGDGHHDAFTRLPHDVGLVPPQVLEQLFVRLVGQEPQRQLRQGDQVIGTEEVGQGARGPFLRVDVAVQHAAAQLFR